MKQCILNPLAVLVAVLAAAGLGRAAYAAGTTQTVTYTAGTPGTEYHAQFSWTVTNVTAKGTFVDGSPWIRVAAGAQLIAVSPVSERRATSSGFQVTINGSAKNPKMQAHLDPDTLQTYLPAKQLFDSRRIFLRPPTNQATIDAAFDFAANIGAVNPSTGLITPVPLAAGDVIVTAKSQWVESRPGTWGSGGSLPHVAGGRRTAIDRFGVLTVVAATPAASSFRPPLQWIVGAESTRPAPIPVSSIITNESALMHPAIGSHAGVDLLLSGPTFHDGDGVLYQSSHAQHAFTADPKLQGTITYGGTMAKAVLRKVLFAATDSGLAAATRTTARNRLIQYGIDSWGATMALGRTNAGAGQRAAEMKPWIMLAGWWLNRAEMKNPYQSIRNLYAGRAVASLDDVSLGRMLFHDDSVARQIVGGMSLGAPYHQAWGPGQPFAVTSSSNATSVRLLDAGTLFGQFGRMEINGARQHSFQHARSPNCYYGCYLRVESGPGAGQTVYRVIEVGNVDGGIGSFVTVDRPWVNGLPGPASTVRMFPFMNGDFVPGLSSDIGRWYYSTNGQMSQRAVDSLSPMANGYARISFKALLVPYAALKRLADVTGDKNYLRGATWNMLSEYVGGSGNSLVSGQLAGGTPNADRIMNQIWPTYRHVGLRSEELATVRTWIGDNGTPSGFGFIDRSRIPGTVANDTAIASVTPCASAAPCEEGVNLLETSPGEDLALSAACVVHSVGWYTYTPTVSGPVTVNTSGGSAFDTRLAVVSNCDGTVLYGCNDNVGGVGGSWSEVTFGATAGATYYLAVGGSSPEAFGTVVVNVLGPSGDEGEGDDEAGDDESEFHDPFDQDDGAGYSLCETAPQVGEGATTLVIEPGLDVELPNDCRGGPDGFNHVRNPQVFRFVPTVAGVHTVSLCGGTSIDTRLMILAGCSETVVACSDDAPGCGDASETSFEGSVGVEYLIVVGSKHAHDTGAALLDIRVVGGDSGPRRLLMCVGSSSLPNPAGTPGLTGVKTHDVVLRDEAAGTWAMHLDGSDVGLGSVAIDALARLDDGSLVISFDKNVNLPGLVGGPAGLAVDRCDLVRFVPTSTGWNTAGQWHFWFDGSDVGLTGGGEDIDAVDVLANGDIVLSTKSKASVPGISNFPSEGLLRFSPTSLGAVTAGSWHVHLDGPDVGLSGGNENIDAVSIGAGGRLTVSTTGNFLVGGLSGAGGDGFDFFPTTLGSYTSGVFAAHFVGSQAGLGGSGKLNALEELPNP